MKNILAGIVMLLISFAIIVSPVYADTQCTLTSILGNSACNSKGEKIHDIDEKNPLKSNEFSCSCDSGSGDSIKNILNLVVDIMTIGIGILGVIGITVVGVQYLTAGGSEEKTRKAKRRMFEIVIGLVAYVLIYAVLKWLGV